MSSASSSIETPAFSRGDLLLDVAPALPNVVGIGGRPNGPGYSREGPTVRIPVIMIGRNRRSESTGLDVHDPRERAPQLFQMRS
jgi:hypothetical protein